MQREKVDKCSDVRGHSESESERESESESESEDKCRVVSWQMLVGGCTLFSVSGD